MSADIPGPTMRARPTRSSTTRRSLLGALGASLFAARALAQAPVDIPAGTPPAPTRRSEVDVPWVPTPDEVVLEMLAFARVTARDLVCDLGSGDGRIPILAATRFGARGLGIELDAELVASSRRKVREAGVERRVRIVHGDILQTDFSEATVVTLYLLTFLNDKLRPRLLKLPVGTRIVAHNYGMNEWDADEVMFLNETRTLLWIVPAQLGGVWRVQAPAEAFPVPVSLSLQQIYQRLSGEVFFGNRAGRIREAEIRGDRARFVVLQPSTGGVWTLHARVESRDGRGATMRGFLTDGVAMHRFTAQRAG